jgi:hypothetical protein
MATTETCLEFEIFNNACDVIVKKGGGVKFFLSPYFIEAL